MAATQIDRVAEHRRVPGLCPAQHDTRDAAGRSIPGTGACARTVATSTIRGRLHEHVRCERCPRAWTRITAE